MGEPSYKKDVRKERLGLLVICVNKMGSFRKNRIKWAVFVKILMHYFWR